MENQNDFYSNPPNKKCDIQDCDKRVGYGFFKDGWFLRKDTCTKHKTSGMIRITNKMIKKDISERKEFKNIEDK